MNCSARAHVPNRLSHRTVAFFHNASRRLLSSSFLSILAHAVNPKLPFSMDPEYQAASRAYMRYHNMDPIFGISSK
jgi:Cytochrome c oxidase subunit IV